MGALEVKEKDDLSTSQKSLPVKAQCAIPDPFNGGTQ